MNTDSPAKVPRRRSTKGRVGVAAVSLSSRGACAHGTMKASRGVVGPWGGRYHSVPYSSDTLSDCSQSPFGGSPHSEVVTRRAGIVILSNTVYIGGRCERFGHACRLERRTRANSTSYFGNRRTTRQRSGSAFVRSPCGEQALTREK